MSKQNKKAKAHQEEQPLQSSTTTTTVRATDVDAISPSAPEDLISRVAINRYDPFQLKGGIDDEIAHVSFLSHLKQLSFLRRIRASRKTTSIQI